MSVEASESMNEAWANLQGHVVDGVFPLHRYLGGSPDSGVFLTASSKRSPNQVALKLVPVAPAAAERLSRWRAAMGLDHPHLLRLFETGRCQLGGVLYLYVVMEHADQTLAQLLERRALTEEEAREMLGPVVSALSYVHDRGLVHGALKPSNILVVGDQLKLASDTVRPIGEVIDCTTVGDVFALGVTLCEGLTRRQPSGLRGEGVVELPSELPAAFREVVARCVSRKAQDRPRLSELEAWARGEQVFSAKPAASMPAVPPAQAPSASVAVPPAEALTVPRSPRPGAQAPATQAPLSAGSAQAPAARVPQAQTPAAHVPAARMSPAQTTSPVASAAPGSAASSVQRSASVPGAQARVSQAQASGAHVPAARSSSAQTPSSAAPGSSTSSVQTPASAASVAQGATSVSEASKAAEVAKGGAAGEPSRPRVIALAIGAVAVFGVTLAIMRTLGTDEAPASAVVAEASQSADLEAPSSSEVPSGIGVGASSATSVSASNVTALGASESYASSGSYESDKPAARPAVFSPTSNSTSVADAAEGEFQASPPEIYQEIPEVPSAASRTIRGRVRVAVRVIVDQDGTVFAALSDNPGPSRYFERLSIEAAKKWQFPPSETDAQRLMLIRFVYEPNSTTAVAIPLP